MNDKFSDFLPGYLQFDSEEQKQDVAKTVKEFYFGEKPVGEDTILRYVDYYTDVLFGYPMLICVKLYFEAGHDKIYLYEYSFVDEDTPFVPFTNVRGATHCAQTHAVLDGDGVGNHDEENFSERLNNVKRIMR